MKMDSKWNKRWRGRRSEQSGNKKMKRDAWQLLDKGNICLSGVVWGGSGLGEDVMQPGKGAAVNLDAV